MAELAITDTSGWACTPYSKITGSLFVLQVQVFASSAVGTFSLDEASGASANPKYIANGSYQDGTTCAKTVQGTITFTRADAVEVDGSYDVTLKTGDHLSGTFSAAVCPVGNAQMGSLPIATGIICPGD